MEIFSRSVERTKSCIWETLTLSTNAYSSTNTITNLLIFFCIFFPGVRINNIVTKKGKKYIIGSDLEHLPVFKALRGDNP